jgi:hypothetical protein
MHLALTRAGGTPFADIADEAEQLLTSVGVRDAGPGQPDPGRGRTRVSRHRIERLTGLANTTIIRMLRADGPGCHRKAQTSDDLRLSQIR